MLIIVGHQSKLQTEAMHELLILTISSHLRFIDSPINYMIMMTLSTSPHRSTTPTACRTSVISTR